MNKQELRIIETIKEANNKCVKYSSDLGEGRILKINKFLLLSRMIIMKEDKINNKNIKIIKNMPVYAVREIEAEDINFAEMICSISYYLMENRSLYSE